MPRKIAKPTEKLAALAAELPKRIGAIESELASVQATLTALDKQGTVNATAYYRDQKYLYLNYPSSETGAGGSRRREYIGSDKKKIDAALACIERHKQSVDLRQTERTLLGTVDYATECLQEVIDTLSGKRSSYRNRW